MLDLGWLEQKWQVHSGDVTLPPPPPLPALDIASSFTFWAHVGPTLISLPVGHSR